MEKINEVKRHLWTNGSSAKKKDWNGISSWSCDESSIVKNIVKKEFSRRYERNSKLIEIIKRKIIKWND